jgi:hypothetical protein
VVHGCERVARPRVFEPEYDADRAEREHLDFFRLVGVEEKQLMGLLSDIAGRVDQRCLPFQCTCNLVVSSNVYDKTQTLTRVNTDKCHPSSL